MAAGVTGEPAAAHDTVGGERIVVLMHPAGGAAFRAVGSDDQPLSFVVAPDGRGWVDVETGTRWDAGGGGVEGPLGGTQLQQLPSPSTTDLSHLAGLEPPACSTDDRVPRSMAGEPLRPTAI